LQGNDIHYMTLQIAVAWLQCARSWDGIALWAVCFGYPVVFIVKTTVIYSLGLGLFAPFLLCPGQLTQPSTLRETVNQYRLSGWVIIMTGCRRAAATIWPAPLLPRGRRSVARDRADGNVAAVSQGQHVPTPTAAAAWRANTAVSKAAWWPWSLTFWPWRWCLSHVWRGLPLCQFWSS